MTRVAVVGRGSAASRTLRILRDMGMSNLFHVASSPMEGFEGNHLPSLESMSVSDVDWVFDCSPASTRVKHAEILAGNGLPTIFEKPLAVNSTAGKRVLELFSAQGVRVRAGYNLRRRHAFDFVRKTLASSSLGVLEKAEISVGQYLPDWRPDRDYRSTVSARKSLGGGVLLELSHDINYPVGFWGRVLELNGETRHSGELEIDVEDWAEARLRFESDAAPPDVTVTLDFLRRSPERWCRIFGQKSNLYWDLLDNRVVISTPSGDSVHHFDDSLDDTYRADVLDMLMGDTPQTGDPQDNADALHALEVVDAWRASSGTGCEAKVVSTYA
jgi:predicted dehydrogenase